jgi:hypothetical protein
METTNKKSTTTRFFRVLLIATMPLTYHFITDIYKIGVKDGKATEQVLAKQGLKK